MGTVTLFSKQRYNDSNYDPPIYFRLYATVSKRTSNSVNIKPKLVLVDLNPTSNSNWMYGYSIKARVEVKGSSTVKYPSNGNKVTIVNSTWNKDVTYEFADQKVPCPSNSENVTVKLFLYSSPNDMHTGEQLTWNKQFTATCKVGKASNPDTPSTGSLGLPKINFNRISDENRVKITCTKGSNGGGMTAMAVKARIYVDNEKVYEADSQTKIEYSVPLRERNGLQTIKVEAQTLGEKPSAVKTESKNYYYYKKPLVSGLRIVSPQGTTMNMHDDVIIYYDYTSPINYTVTSMDLYISIRAGSDQVYKVKTLPQKTSELLLDNPEDFSVYGGVSFNFFISINYKKVGSSETFSEQYNYDVLSVNANPVFVATGNQIKQETNMYVCDKGVLRKISDMVVIGGYE